MSKATKSSKVSRRKRWITVGAITVLLVALGVWVYYLEEREQRTTGGGVVADWTEYKDPHGFSVMIPQGWAVEVGEAGLVKIGPEGGSATAFAATMTFSKAKTSDQVLGLILPELQNAFPGFEVVSKRTLDKYQSLVCQIKYTGYQTIPGDAGSEYVGAMLISTDGKNAFVSGLADEKEKFNESRSDLLKVLSTFTHDRSLQDSSKISGMVQMVSWKDPKEGAFTVDVPKGWNVSGGIVRPYIDAGVKMIVTSGDRGIQIENPYPPIYVTPSWVLEMAGFTEGSHYNPAGGIAEDMIVMSEKSAESYIRNILTGKLSLSVKSVKSRSDLVKKVPKMPWTTKTTAAEAVLGGDGKKHKVIVIEQGANLAGTGLWAVILVHYWAPEDELALVEEIVAAMDGSFKLDSAWAAQEQAEVAKRVGIINKAGDEIANIISSTFEYQSGVQDRAARQWSDAMLGINRVYNPNTGEGYEVPIGAEHYWSDGYNIVGTQVSEPPTYHDDWTELLPLD